MAFQGAFVLSVAFAMGNYLRIGILTAQRFYQKERKN